MRDQGVLDTVNKFLKADGPPKILFYFQLPTFSDDEEDEEPAESGPPALFAADGEGPALAGKGMYFIRHT